MRSFLFFIFFLAVSSLSFSQEKTFFDRTGKPTTEEQSYFYRQKKDGDLYNCYYTNGNAIYFEGKIIQPSTEAENKNMYAGTCTWYYKNGKKKAIRTFTDAGIENGTSFFYYESGKIWKEIEYSDGKIVNNRYKEFEEDGRMSRIFEEEFNSNANDWDLYVSDKGSAKISDGMMELISHASDGTSRYINLSASSGDFAAEAPINIEKLKEGEKAGMLFGFKDWQNYNFFAITQSSFYVGYIFEGVSSIKVEGMFSSAINKKAVNNLKIISLGEKTIFSINGEVQYSSDKFKMFGNNAGFVVSGKSAITIDKFIFKEFDFKSAGVATSKEDMDVKASGSGLIFSSSGYIATNYHVVEDANKILIEMIAGGSSVSYSAKLIQKDVDNDIAILKIDDEAFKPITTMPYSFKESGGVDVGASVFTIGFPMALGGMGKEAKFADGKISSKTGYNNALNTYQTTVPVQPGNSGGPLFNEKGELIGLVNAKIKGADNVSYAIKLTYLKNLIEVLPETIALPANQSLANTSTEEKVKALSNFVVLIKIK